MQHGGRGMACVGGQAGEDAALRIHCPSFQTAILHSGDQKASVRSQALGLDLGLNVRCLGCRFARQRAMKTLPCR